MADLLGGADPHSAITALTTAGHETDTCRIGTLSRDSPSQHRRHYGRTERYAAIKREHVPS